MSGTRLVAIAKRGTLVAMHKRSRDAVLRTARLAKGADRAEWVSVARDYHRALLAAKRKEREAQELIEQRRQAQAQRA